MIAIALGSYGRRTIYTLEPEITRDNLLHVLRKAVVEHDLNSSDIKYLWGYYKGVQPVLERKKAVRPEINNIIVENHASEIVAFFSGYLLGEPCSYVRRGNDDSVSGSIDNLNEMMFSEDKASCDKELATWIYVCGVGYRMCLPDKARAAKPRLNRLRPAQRLLCFSGVRKPIIGARIPVRRKHLSRLYADALL